MSQIPSIPAFTSVVAPAQTQVAADSSYLTNLIINAGVNNGTPTASAQFTLAAYSSTAKLISPDRSTDVVTSIDDLWAYAGTYPMIAQILGAILTAVGPLASLQKAKAAMASIQSQIDAQNAILAMWQAHQTADQAAVASLNAQIAAINAAALSDADKSLHIDALTPLLTAAEAAVTNDAAQIAAVQGQVATLTAQLAAPQAAITTAETALGKTG